jgi:Type II secretion system (T2SS), protein E, N-terminal domain
LNRESTAAHTRLIPKSLVRGSRQSLDRVEITGDIDVSNHHMSQPVRLDHSFFEHEVRPYLGAVLLQAHLLRPEQLDQALEAQRGSGKRLGEVLIELGFLYEQDISRALAQQAGLTYVDLQATSVDPRAASRLNPEVGQRLRAVPVRFEGDGLLVAVADPVEVPASTLSAETRTNVELCVGDPSEILGVWRRLLSGYR